MITNHSSSIELNRKALSNNLKFIRNFLSKKTKLSSVIKGNAYGHGIKQMLPELEKLGVDHFSVFSSFEAKIAYQYAHKSSTIMIMGDISESDIPWVVSENIDFFVYNFTGFQSLLKEAKKQKEKLCIHLELETGMNRHGFQEVDWPALIELMKKNTPHFIFRGICTHFAGAESSANYKRIQKQQSQFLKGVEFFKNEGFTAERLHTSCSAGMIAYPDFNLDMVRVGILQYGLWPSNESKLTYRANFDFKQSLQSVLSWHSKILEIKKVKAGEFINYGTSFLAETDMEIASIPVGYGYGFSRTLSNIGRVLVNGKRLSVIGTVNMNMFLIDVTNVQVNIGDIVTLIGNDKNQEIKVSYFGNLSEQLNYELLTRLDKSIPRKVV